MAYATAKDYTALAYPLSPVGSPKSAADDWKIGSSLAEVRRPALHAAPCCIVPARWEQLADTIARQAHSKKVHAVKQATDLHYHPFIVCYRPVGGERAAAEEAPGPL